MDIGPNPGRQRPGLIEAIRLLTIRAIRARIRGVSAPASLKPALEGTLNTFEIPNPGRQRPGLIEARSAASGASRVRPESGASAPRPH